MLSLNSTACVSGLLINANELRNTLNCACKRMRFVFFLKQPKLLRLLFLALSEQTAGNEISLAII